MRIIGLIIGVLTLSRATYGFVARRVASNTIPFTTGSPIKGFLTFRTAGKVRAFQTSRITVCTFIRCLVESVHANGTNIYIHTH